MVNLHSHWSFGHWAGRRRPPATFSEGASPPPLQNRTADTLRRRRRSNSPTKSQLASLFSDGDITLKADRKEKMLRVEVAYGSVGVPAGNRQHYPEVSTYRYLTFVQPSMTLR